MIRGQVPIGIQLVLFFLSRTLQGEIVFAIVGTILLGAVHTFGSDDRSISTRVFPDNDTLFTRTDELGSSIRGIRPWMDHAEKRALTDTVVSHDHPYFFFTKISKVNFDVFLSHTGIETRDIGRFEIGQFVQVHTLPCFCYLVVLPGVTE